MKFKAAFAAVYVVVASIGASYLAAVFFFVVNKTIPASIDIDTWYRYWKLYQNDDVQSGRLITSVAFATAIVYGIPLITYLRSFNKPRALYGDARWATRAEIRAAGLL